MNNVTTFPKNCPYFDAKTEDSIFRDFIENTGLLNSFTKDSSDNYYQYDGKIMKPITDNTLKGFVDTGIIKKLVVGGYNDKKVSSVTAMCSRGLSDANDHKAGFIGFNNGVLDINTWELHPHDKRFGLRSCAEFDYSPDETECPNFCKWLDDASKVYFDDSEILNEKATEDKRDLILATFYTVMTNNYLEQKFFEITGEGGSGKSVMAAICSMLTAKTCSIPIEQLEGATNNNFPLEPIIGASLILCPDVKKFAGDMNTLKAVTGNDAMSINRKYQKSLLLDPVPAVVVITSNQPLAVTDQSMGVWRRRIVISFPYIVKNPDSELRGKIEREKVAIFNMVKNEFDSREKVSEILRKAINNSDKKKAVIESDPLAAWVDCALINDVESSCQIGGYNSFKAATIQKGFAYFKGMKKEAESKLYSNYMSYCLYAGIKMPLSQKKFSENAFDMMIKLGFTCLTKVKPYNRATINGVKMKNDAPHLVALQDDIDNYATLEETRQ